MLVAVENPATNVEEVTLSAEEKSRPSKRKRSFPLVDQYLKGKKLKVVYTAQVSARGRALPRDKSIQRAQYVVKAFKPTESNNFLYHDLQWKRNHEKNHNLKVSCTIGTTATPIKGGNELLGDELEARRKNADESLKLGIVHEERAETGMIRPKTSTTDAFHGRLESEEFSRIEITPKGASEADNVECCTAETSEITRLKGNSKELTPARPSSAENKLEIPRRNGKNNVTGSDATVHVGNDTIVKNRADVVENSNFPKFSVVNMRSSVNSETLMHFQVSPNGKTTNKNYDAQCQSKFVVEKTDDTVPKQSETQAKNHTKVNTKLLTNDLLHLLRKFNLTLKAFPITKDLADRVTDGTLKCNAVVVNPDDSGATKVVTTVGGDSCAGVEYYGFPVKSKCVTGTLSTVSHNRCRSTPCISKDTLHGTFSEWKITKTRFPQSCPSFMRNSDGVKATTKSKVLDSSIPKNVSGQRKQRKRYRILNTMPECNGRSRSLNSDSHRAKGSDTSHSQNSLQMVPLATAFHDLETRDRAARETLSFSCTTEVPMKRTYFSPSMGDALDEGATEETVKLRTDPVLTSAAFQKSDESDVLTLNAATLIASSIQNPQRESDSAKEILFNGGNCNSVKQSSPDSLPSSSSLDLSRSENLSTAMYDFAIENSLYGKEIQCDTCSTENTSDVPVSSATNSSCDLDSDLERRASDECFKQLETSRAKRNTDSSELAQPCLKSGRTSNLEEALSSSEEEEESQKSTKMYRDGHCAITAPPQVPVTSVEQLEESVNIDDLLGSDSIMSSIELADVLDSQTGSYLKYLGNDCSDFRVTAPNGFLSHCGIPAVSNHFSQPSRPSTVSQTSEYNAIRFSHQLRGDTSGYSSHYDVHGNGSLFSQNEIPPNDRASVCLQNSCLYTVDVNRLSSMPMLSIPDHSVTSYRPVSPSTYCNLPTVGKSRTTSTQSHNGKVNELYSETYPTSKAHERSDTRFHDIIAYRDISDSDSGIHSPELQSPSKYISNGVAMRNAREYSEDPSTSHQDSPVCLPCKTYSSPQYRVPNTCWIRETESIIPTPIETAPVKSSAPGCGEETWDCASTSSNATTLSVETEAKLLNMDEYKSYLTYEAPKNVRINSQDSAYSISLTPGKEDVKFKPHVLDEFRDGDGSFTVNGKNLAQENFTAIPPPPFVPHVRSTPSNESCGDISPSRETSQSVGFPGGSMKSVDDNDATGHLQENQDQENGVGKIVGRRHTCDAPDSTSYIDPYDVKIRRTSGKNVHLWEFIRDTLLNPQYCPRLIKWEDRKAGVFRFVQSDVVAGMWGEKKNNPKMTYEKLSRAMRYYYNRGILERVESRRLVYKFGDKAHGWQQTDAECNVAGRPNSDGQLVKEEPPADFIFPSQRPRPRKIKSCRISVSVSNDVVPNAKRRRLSNEKIPAFVSIATNQQKSAETQPPPSLQKSMEEVKKSVTIIRECKQEPAVNGDAVSPENLTKSDAAVSPGHCKSPVEHPSCIVYVAHPEMMNNQESEEEITLYNSNEMTSWSQEAQEHVQSKLPSADVLLGKQYKIANAVM